MEDPKAQRDRAVHFRDQVKAQLDKEFGSSIDYEGDHATNIKFLIKTGKKYEMMLEYNESEDSYELYDRDDKTQKNETLGTFSPKNITTPGDPTPSEIVKAVKNHAV